MTKKERANLFELYVEAGNSGDIDSIEFETWAMKLIDLMKEFHIVNIEEKIIRDN